MHECLPLIGVVGYGLLVALVGFAWMRFVEARRAPQSGVKVPAALPDRRPASV